MASSSVTRVTSVRIQQIAGIMISPLACMQIMFICLMTFSGKVKLCTAKDISQVPPEFLGLWYGSAMDLDVSLALIPGAGELPVGLMVIQDACVHKLKIQPLSKKKKKRRKGSLMAVAESSTGPSCVPVTFTFEVAGRDKLVADAKFTTSNGEDVEVLFVLEREDDGISEKVCKAQEVLSPAAKLKQRLESQNCGKG